MKNPVAELHAALLEAENRKKLNKELRRELEKIEEKQQRAKDRFKAISGRAMPRPSREIIQSHRKRVKELEKRRQEIDHSLRSRRYLPWNAPTLYPIRPSMAFALSGSYLSESTSLDRSLAIGDKASEDQIRIDARITPIKNNSRNVLGFRIARTRK